MFHNQRTVVCEMIKDPKTRYYNEKLCEADQSAAFKTIKSLLQPSTNKNLPSASSNQQLADSFVTFFSEKVEKIRASFTCLQNDLTPPLQDVPTTATFCSFSPVTTDDVKRIIKKSSAKSCSLDVIPTWFLKDSNILEALLPPIKAYINASLEAGYVPDCHKSAIVTPLLKKDGLDVNIYKNYRPVSNLSFISKLLEKVVAEQLIKHMTENNLHDPLQSAYRPAHSVESALVKVKGDIDRALGEGDGVLLLLLDLSAAFDTVDHSLLLDRLENQLGIKGIAKKWIESYLTSRTQSVVICGVKSKSMVLSTGVPQGSVLGPLLFLAYVLPLGSIIDAHNVSRHGYADDTQMYLRFSLKHISSLLQARDVLQDCAGNVRNWMTQNRLKVNDAKTEFLIIAPKHFHTKLQPASVTIRVGDSDIPPCSSVRNLGAHLDQHLDMGVQVSQVVRGMYSNIRRIGKIRHLLTQDTCVTLTSSLVISRLDYHNALLANVPHSTLAPLQLAQNVAARLATGTRRGEHMTPILQALHWLPVHKRIMYKVLTLVYRAVHDGTPKYLADLLTVYRPTRTLRSMEAPLLLNQPRSTRSIGERSFVYAGPKMWNSLPADIRSAATAETFKKNLKTYLFSL